MHARSETARVAAIRELLDRAYGEPTQFLATDDDVIPEDMSAAELRAEIVAQFVQAFPEYRVLKVVPPPNERAAKRRQTLTNGPPAALISSAARAKANAGLRLSSSLADSDTNSHRKPVAVSTKCQLVPTHLLLPVSNGVSVIRANLNARQIAWSPSCSSDDVDPRCWRPQMPPAYDHLPNSLAISTMFCVGSA
jgi:hypothetical protein